MKTRTLLPTLVGLIMLCLGLKAQDKTLSPYFHVPCQECNTEEFPLLRTDAEVDISGVIADVRIRQVYKNDGAEPIEAIYVFPGSTRSAVYDMQMRIGERVIRAVVQERGKARKTYEQARREGRRSALLEQERPNVFQMNVANIMPGDEVVVELAYTEWLTPEAGIYEFVFPTVVGPRYGGESTEEQLTADRWVENPYLEQGSPVPFDWSLALRLHAGMPVQRMYSPSHEIDIQYSGKDEAHFRLENGAVKDVIVHYQLEGREVQEGLLLYEGEEENFFLLMMQPPERPRMKQMPAREYVFIVDVSGSMNGYPLQVSKALLRDLIGDLRPADRFNVMLFSSGSATLHPRSVPATKENLEQAIRLIDGQRGGGGTNMLAAVQRAMALPKAEVVSRSFVIATDGFVNAEPQLFDYIRDNLGEANFFAFGIGTSVNRHLIEGIAHIGQAEAFVATTPDEAGPAAGRFREYISTPVLTDLQVDFGEWDTYELSPPQLPDLMAERPVMIFGKYRGEPGGSITLRGRNAAGAYESSLSTAGVNAGEQHAALRYLWARHRLQQLSDYAGFAPYAADSSLIRQVTGLGLRYNLLTKYTSFVAVDTVIANTSGEAPHPTRQPLPLPEGVPNSAVGVRIAEVGAEAEIGFTDQSTTIGATPGIAGNFAPPAPSPPPPPPPEPAVTETFTVVEQMPRFPAGDCERTAASDRHKKACADKAMMEFVYDHLDYPAEAREKGVEGTVVVQFTIRKDGSIGDIRIVRDIGAGCGEAARRVVELMRDTLGPWVAGRQRGRLVNVTLHLPVKFRLNSF